MNWDTRAVTPRDVPGLQKAECLARSLAPSEHRTAEHLAFVLAHDAGASRVAVAGESIVGYCVCVTLGRLGFIGAIGVVPDARGQGIGGALLDECREQLAAHCEIVGVQCLVDEEAMLGQFLTRNFQLVEPQLVLARETDRAGQRQAEDAPRAAVPLQDIFAVEEHGRALAQHRLGRACVRGADAGSATGVLAVELVPRRAGMRPGTAAVTAGCVQRDLTAVHLRGILEDAAAAAREQSCSTMFLALNGFYQRELRALLADNWALRQVSYRLVYAPHIARYKQVLSLPQLDLSHWTL
jgi:GNAT superfamily N-acetyltransferase